MIQQDDIADGAQFNQTLLWLEEQRKVDKDHIERAQHELDRLGLQLKELASQLQQITEESKVERSRLAALPFAEEGIRQLREQVSVLEQRLDAQEQAQNRDTMLRQSEFERERKTLVEFSQQISELERQDEQHQGKVQTLADDARRWHNDLSSVAERLEVAEKEVEAINGRIRLFEEQIRRLEQRATTSEQIEETLRTESARFQQWQQAAELRWTRQISQWAEQMDQWRREMSDHVNSLAPLAKQIAQTKDEILEMRGELAENRKILDDQAGEMLRAENVRAHDREDAARLEQALDGQRRRLDEQSATLKQVQEQMLQSAEGLAQFGGRLEGERKRGDDTHILFRQLETKQTQLADDLTEVQRLLRERSMAADEQSKAWLRELEGAQAAWAQQFAAFLRVAEQQKDREIAESERQLLEIRDQLNVSKHRGNQ